LTYILPLTLWVYLPSNFSGVLCKTILPQKCVSAVKVTIPERHRHPRSLILVPIESVIQSHWFWYQSKACVQ